MNVSIRVTWCPPTSCVALLGWVGVRVPGWLEVAVVVVVVVPPLVVEVPVELDPEEVDPPEGAGNPAGIDERVTHRQDQHR